MADISLGWTTDLEVLRLGGSTISHRADHILVETPDNPGFHWGNFILVTDDRLAVDPQACVGVFRAALPQASHLAIGLPGEPAAGWESLDVILERDEVLTSPAPPPLRPPPRGYSVRQLRTQSDWDACAEAELAEFVRNGGSVDAEFERYVRGRMRARAVLTGTGRAAFFGAFDADGLAADLGIVLVEQGARYQSVSTAFGHRRRGLASHLLSVAGGWAADRGAQLWVILAEPGSDARRLYGALGFGVAGQSVQVYAPTYWGA
ncbi:MAG: GNAT family N-acetyltransferase [Candidatus Nanopelagicales bacterium]|nr:GNAT family N-acetyltransferase [Candidatus Nanopelagicales bacterium]